MSEPTINDLIKMHWKNARAKNRNLDWRVVARRVAETVNKMNEGARGGREFTPEEIVDIVKTS